MRKTNEVASLISDKLSRKLSTTDGVTLQLSGLVSLRPIYFVGPQRMNCQNIYALF